MSAIVLSAINAEHFPLNFLAALGIQNILDRSMEPSVKLHWVQDPIWTAVVSNVDSIETVVATLKREAEQIPGDRLWNRPTDSATRDSKGITQFLVEDYRRMIHPMAWEADTWRWMGLVTEWPDKKGRAGNPGDGDGVGEIYAREDASGGQGPSFVSPTRLHMLTGAQTDSFLEFIRDATMIAATKPDAIEEALFGPWRYEDAPTKTGNGWDETTLGWETSIRHSWAFTDRKPENMKKSTVATIAWMAAEGLRSLPTWNGGTQPRTTGIAEDSSFIFPIWDRPMSLFTVVRLLWSVSSRSDQWRRRGVRTLLQCRRGTGGSKYQPVLLPPTALW